MNNAWLDILIAAVVVGLLLAALFFGETGKINNPGCPDRFQKYQGVTCE